MKTHSDYIKQFGEVFYEQTKLLIDRNQAKQNSYSTFKIEDSTLIQVNIIINLYFVFS